MGLFALKPSRVLFLAVVAAAMSLRVPAQVVSLSPALTDDPETAPVTTLATDLLAPPVPYIFDPTGASIVATASNPSVYSFSLSSSASQTDTAIRDASQSGRTNPFLNGMSRTDVSYFEASTSIADQNASTRNSSTSMPAAGPAPSSRWGSSENFNSSSDSRGATKTAGTERLGKNLRNSQYDPLAMQNQSPAGSNLSTQTMRTLSNRATTRSLNTTANRNHSSSSGTTARAGQITSINPVTEASLQPGMSKAADQAPLFSPPGPGDSPFDASPFSAPGGEGTLQFLNPDILGRLSKAPSTSARRARTTSPSDRERFNAQNDTLATSATHYGLTTHSQMNASRYRTGYESKTRNRKHLSSIDNGYSSLNP